MAYSTTNGPVLVLQAPSGLFRVWALRGADAHATVDNSGYISDGYSYGMRDGDMLWYYDTGSKIWSAHTVTVSGTTVDLADGTNIGITTNTN